MPHDVLLDFIMKEGEKRVEDISVKAQKKAGVMLSDLKKRIQEHRESAFKKNEGEIAGYRVKELNRAKLKGQTFITLAMGEIVDELYREIDTALQSLVQDASYPGILRRLLIEGLKEMTGRVEVLANSKDCRLIKDLLHKTGVMDCEVTSVTADDRINGGVEIISCDNGMSIINTLWSRLDKAKDDLMPEAKNILFPT